MAKRISKNGPRYSDTLLKGAECLWLGFHKNVGDYLNIPITNTIFQQRALHGYIGKINQAGLYGAEVEFPVESAKGFARLNVSVEELLPMTTQQVDELRKSISNIKGEITVAIQTDKTKRPESTTTTRKDTYRCEVNGCSFSSPSPQGLGTHRVKSHNLASRSQKRSGGRKVLITKTHSEVSKPVSNTVKTTVLSGKTTSNTRDDWKAKHDAVVKRYNRLSTKHESIIKTLRKLSNGTT